MTPDEMMRLGKEHEQQGDRAEAERLYGAAGEAGNAEAMNRCGVLAGKRGAAAVAEEWFRSAAATGDVIGAYNLAHTLRERGDHAGAEEWYRKAADGGFKDAVWGLGHTLHAMGRLEEASGQYLKSAGFGHTKSMNWYGILLKKQGDLPAAEEWYRKAAEAGDPDGMHNLATMLRGRRDHAEAEEWYRKAAADGGDEDAVWGLALTLTDLGRPDEAEGLFHKAARGGNAAAMNRYGLSMKRQGDIERAEEWYCKAAEAGNADAMYNVGVIMRERGDAAEEERWFRKSADAGDEMARYELARTLVTLERLDEAQELFRALADGGHEKAAERLAELAELTKQRTALYTSLLKIKNADGDWRMLRDLRTSEVEYLDTVTAAEDELPGIAQRIMAKLGVPNCRVDFYLGDRTGLTKFKDGSRGYTVTGPERRVVGRDLGDDNVYGTVTHGSDRLEPGPAAKEAVMNEDGIIAVQISPDRHVEILLLSNDADEAVRQIAEILGFPSDAPDRAFPGGYTFDRETLTGAAYEEYRDRPIDWSVYGFDRWYAKVKPSAAGSAMMLWYDDDSLKKQKPVNAMAMRIAEQAYDRNFEARLTSMPRGTAIYSGYDLQTKQIRSVPLKAMENCLEMEAFRAECKQVRAWRLARE